MNMNMDMYKYKMDMYMNEQMNVASDINENMEDMLQRMQIDHFITEEIQRLQYVEIDNCEKVQKMASLQKYKFITMAQIYNKS